MNLHKLLSNTTVEVRRVRLNETKYIILYFIRINFKDHIDCNEPLATVAIAALILTDVHTMRADYLQPKHTNKIASNLGDVPVPTLTSSKLVDFKTVIR